MIRHPLFQQQSCAEAVEEAKAAAQKTDEIRGVLTKIQRSGIGRGAFGS
jgi:hypothetical protein